MPEFPGAHALMVMLLTVFALYLFTRDRIPLETAGMGVLLLLLLAFQFWPMERDGEQVIEPTDFFLNVGHEALITITALLVAGKGLEITGALRPVALFFTRLWNRMPLLAALLTLVGSAVFSAFVNNTPVVVMLLPVLTAAALHAKQAPSAILLPMGFATLIGGMSTVIGTSTNLLVVKLAEQDLGLPTFGMFSFSLPVLLVGSVGIVFLWLLAPRLTPERTLPLAKANLLFTSTLTIRPGGFADGKTVAEIRARTNKEMLITRIVRGNNVFLHGLDTLQMRAGDRLFVRDTMERLSEYEDTLGASLPHGEDRFRDEPQQIAELVVTRGSPLDKRSVRAAHLDEIYGLVPLAIHRAGVREAPTHDLLNARLSTGDVLLVQASRAEIRRLTTESAMLVLGRVVELPRSGRANAAVAIMAAIIVPAALGWAPIVLTSVTGVGLMIAAKCMSWRNVRDAFNVPLTIIIVASLSLGQALIKTGAADWLAQVFVVVSGDLPVPLILSGLMLLMAILTNVVSNNAAAIIGTPIAYSFATGLGAPVEPFILAVIFGANMSFLTPIGYQTNLLIMSAGGYRRLDFLRIGAPLTLIMWAGFSLLLPMMYAL